MQKIADMALAYGFTEAVWMDNLTLECEESLRAHCNPEECPNYGTNWVCPPGCGSLPECAEKAGRFHKGILLRSVTDLAPPVDPAEYIKLKYQHNLRLREYLDAFEKTEVLALTNGGCIFCAECAYPEPCIKPNVRMDALSAFGIDVGRLCAQANLDYSFREDRIYYVALVLLA